MASPAWEGPVSLLPITWTCIYLAVMSRAAKDSSGPERRRFSGPKVAGKRLQSSGSSGTARGRDLLQRGSRAPHVRLWRKEAAICASPSGSSERPQCMVMFAQ
jgi:hypothetical protein